MSLYWSTKSVGGREYTVIQHPLRDTSTKVCGVKFHCGYGVVQKESKAYKMLRSMPLFRSAKEFPLTLLKSLKFITRSQDIALIYGKDVFITYQRELIQHNKKQEAQKFEETRSERNSEKSSKCKYLLLHNDFCNNEKVFGSNGYCRMHILEDKELIKEMGIEIPSYVGREGFGKETSVFLAKICKKIDQHTRDKSKKELNELLIESNETQEVS